MPKITKALIAAGGWSTRFLPTVKTYAKQLVPIVDRPQIHWVIEELIGAGITDIAINVRGGETSLLKHFSPDPDLDQYLSSAGKEKCLDGLHYILDHVSIKFYYQTKDYPYGNGAPVLVAKEFIGSDPFVYLWGDDITIEDQPGAFLKGAIDLFDQHHPAVVECVQEVPWDQVYRYGTVKYMENPKFPNQICQLAEKLPTGQAPSNIIQGGRFVVSPKIIPVLENTPQAKGELWFADAVNYLAQNDVVITHNYTQNQAFWATTGDPQNWLKANLILAHKHPDYQKTVLDFAREYLK